MAGHLDYAHIYAYIESMRYIFDQKKQAANLKKHGFDYDEQRFITLGVLRDDVVVITTAETDETIRVISMRKAERNEEKIYYDNL